jgi:hypothetical protein
MSLDIEFTRHGIRFVADAAKARANPIQHDGITFEQAAESFFDPLLKWADATRNGEAREAIIGMTASSFRLLFVVHILVEDDRIRLISARKATREERKYYEDG